MAGESILIVEDAPESLKLTAGVLRREGYRISIASTAEQALSTLRFLQPELILVDFMLPGMNGLDLTARIKQDSRLQRTVVVALTACAEPAHESRARQLGCAGYLIKPVESRLLITRVRDFLDFGKETPGAYKGAAAPASNGIAGLPDGELAELQDSFLKAGKGLSRQLLASVDGDFDREKAGRTVHRWIGSAGLLGFADISLRARDVQNVLSTPILAPERLRGPFTNLARAFENAGTAAPESRSPSVARVLQGTRVALIGLSDEAADLMCGALEEVGAKPRLFDGGQSPYAEAVSICQLVVVHVRPENVDCRWLARDVPGLPVLPAVFFGSPEHLLTLSANAQGRARGLLMDGCMRQEVAMRLRLAMLPPPPPVSRPVVPEPRELVIACGDVASRAPIEAKMKECGLRGRLAANGPETILLLRHLHPPAAVVDVNQDGFEALATIRAEDMPVRTMFIASQGSEDEILRGFSLGAEDYLVHPFSSLELVARLKRLSA